MFINEKGKLAHLLEQTQEGDVIYVMDGQKTEHTVPAHEFFGGFREATKDEASDAKGREDPVS